MKLSALVRNGVEWHQRTDFLAVHDAKLEALGSLAERYFRDDPSTAIFKLRQFAELTAKMIAARHGAYRDEPETFEKRCGEYRMTASFRERWRTSSMRCGRRATSLSTAKGGNVEALTALKFARSLGVWFHRPYGKKPNFAPGAFIPPPEPVDASAALRSEIEALRQKVVESEDAVAAARREHRDEGPESVAQ